jgi:acetyl-CoA synthetase
MTESTIFVPRYFNIVVHRHAEHRLALVEVDANGSIWEYSFGDIKRLAGRLFNTPLGLGLVRGDRVAILLPQRHETAVARVAIYQAAMIAVPLFVLFGTEALEFRLRHCSVSAIMTNREGAAKLHVIRAELPDLLHILCVDEDADDTISVHHALDKAAERIVNTKDVIGSIASAPPQPPELPPPRP